MKTGFVAVFTLLAGAAAGPYMPSVLPNAALKPRSSVISGDYVEARTASVFAGACHYNAEVVTTGQDAVMAWNVTSGMWKGVDLAGVRAMAAVTSDANLGDKTAARRCELQIDPSATPAQDAAFADWLHTRYVSTMGTITAVRQGSVSFDHHARVYNVNAPGFGMMAVQGMPNDECCSQPSLVWYTPLMPLEHRKVGYTVESAYTAGTLADTWQRADENSAFYGAFAQ